MDDRSSIVAAAEVLQNSDWSQLVSLEIGVNGSHPTKEHPALHGVAVGTIVGFVDDALMVTYSGQAGSAAVPCRTTVDVSRDSVGRQALLVFEHGDARRPILVGCVRDSLSALVPAVDVKADGETVTVTGQRANRPAMWKS